MLVSRVPLDVPLAKIHDLIRSWPWFEYVPPEAHQWLAARAVPKRVSRGEQLFLAGQAAVHIYGVLEGSFRLFIRARNGDEVNVGEAVSGGWFPHLGRKEIETYLHTCSCQQDALVCVIPRTVSDEFGERWPGYFKGLYYETADRGLSVLGRIELLSLHGTDVRLAVYLARMAQLRGVAEPAGRVRIPNDANQTELGARVGGGRQTINTLLQAWVRDGIIEAQKDSLCILDMKRLAAVATQSGFDLDSYLAAWPGIWQRKR